MDLNRFTRIWGQGVWIYIDLGGFVRIWGQGVWFYMDLCGFREIWGHDVCQPVGPFRTGVVGPKERLLQSQLLQSQNAVSEAWRPVGLEAGIDWSDCRQVLEGFLAWRGVLSRSTLGEVGGFLELDATM